MNVQNIPEYHFYLPGFLATLFGLVAITYSVRLARLDPDSDWRIALCILFSSVLGALLFQMGVGICVAWIMVRRSGSATVTLAQDLRSRTTVPSELEKHMSLKQDSSMYVEGRRPSTGGDDPDAVPIDFKSRYAKHYLAVLGCAALATSLQIASVVTRMYDEDGVMVMGTWTWRLSITGLTCHFAGYLLALYSWCRALSKDDARLLPSYRQYGKTSTVGA